MNDQIERLDKVLDDLGSVVVALSGGADSALVASVARRRLGRSRALCVTAVSPSLAPEELADCAALACEWDLEWIAFPTGELADDAYVANGPDRCYHCKTELLSVLSPLAAARSATTVLGVNLDDLDDHRPGQVAAARAGASFPLVHAGLTKSDVRAVSRALGLRTADKPAAACLASRIPHGTPVTLAVLDRVARSESALRRLGFTQVRVRHYGECARLELDPSEISRALESRDEIVAALKGAGYRYATLDLEGFRSGNLARPAADVGAHDR